VYIEQLGKLDLKALYQATTPERQLQKLVVEYEKFLRERLPVCSADKGELVETSCTIMDLKNVGISQFWKVSGRLGLVLFLLCWLTRPRFFRAGVHLRPTG
jgi:hypothetical protein